MSRATTRLTQLLIPSGDITISLGTIASGSVVYGPTLVPGAVTISLGTIPSGSVVYGLDLALGVSTIPLGTIPSGSVVYGLDVVPGTASVALGAIPSGSVVYGLDVVPGSVAIPLGTIPSGSVVYGPGISAGAAPSVAPGAYYPPGVVTRAAPTHAANIHVGDCVAFLLPAAGIEGAAPLCRVLGLTYRTGDITASLDLQFLETILEPTFSRLTGVSKPAVSKNTPAHKLARTSRVANRSGHRPGDTRGRGH